MKKTLLLILCALFAVGPFAGNMLASSDIVRDRYVDLSTRVDDSLCAFPVVVSGSSNINDLIFLDDNGKPVRLLSTVNHAEITFTANGKSLTAKGSGGIEYLVNPDGTISVNTFGINLLLTIPEYGPVFLDTGRAVFLFDTDRHLHELFHADRPAITWQRSVKP